MVVDGQQRLTTLTILLSVLRDMAEPNIARAIHNYYLSDRRPHQRQSTDVLPV